MSTGNSMERILVVDDSAETLELLDRNLSMAGYSVLKASGNEPDQIVLAGGASQSRLWCQMVADMFNLPVRPLAVRQQSALGAAILGGAGIGLLDLEAATQGWIRYRPTVEPDPGRHDLYMGLFNIFRSAYKRHRSDFHKLWELE